jgi:hypothetical protein
MLDAIQELYNSCWLFSFGIYLLKELVISDYCNIAAFNLMAPILQGEHDSQKFTFLDGIPLLRKIQFLAKICHRI